MIILFATEAFKAINDDQVKYEYDQWSEVSEAMWCMELRWPVQTGNVSNVSDARFLFPVLWSLLPADSAYHDSHS